jgi:hypothetical protein
MHGKFLFKLCALFIIANLVACKNYSISVNDNLVYTPPTLFTAFSITNEHLRNCIEQTINDKQITKAEDLKELNCSHAGITNLAGLEKFSAIEKLNLSENALVTVPQLINLTQLKVLILRKNNLTNAEPLLHLLHLKEVDISENKNLVCGDVKQLINNFNKGDLTIILPEQCKAKA